MSCPVALLDAGLYANIVLPPACRPDACLLRTSYSAAHTPKQIAKEALFGAIGGLFPFGFLGILASLALTYLTSPLGPLSKFDPPVANLLVNLNVPDPNTPGATASTATAKESTQSAGQVSGTVGASTAVASGKLTASWQSVSDGSFIASFLEASLAASGDTEAEALDGLKDRIITTFERLESKTDDKLGPVPLRQKQLLTSLIRRLR